MRHRKYPSFVTVKMNFVEIDGRQCNKNARSVTIRMHLANPWTWEKQDVKEWATRLFGDQLAEAFEGIPCKCHDPINALSHH